MICCKLIAQKGTEYTAPVIGITDGDTIRVLHDGVSTRIRLWGIDCPESKQAFGTRAKQLTGDLSFGRTVTVRVHDIDRYHRQVAEIILPDGRNLNRELVKAGMAWWYRQYAKHNLKSWNQRHERRSVGCGSIKIRCRRGSSGNCANRMLVAVIMILPSLVFRQFSIRRQSG